MDKIIFEISELEKYVDLSNLTGITSENYAGWIGEYKLGKQEVFCQCLLDKANVCNQKHGHGFIVKLSSGEKSIIGNTCVKHFGTKTQLRRDYNSHINRQRALGKLGNLNQYIDNKEEYLSELKHLESLFIELSAKAHNFQQQVSNEIAKLQKYVKSPKIEIQGIKYKSDTKNPSGKKISDKIPFTIGTLNGLDAVLDIKKYGSFNFHHKQFIKALDDLPLLIEKYSTKEAKLSEKEIDKHRKQLESFKSAKDIIERLKYDFNTFFNIPPNVLVFCYDRPYNLIMATTQKNRNESKDFCSLVLKDFKEKNKLDSISYEAMSFTKNYLG